MLKKSHLDEQYVARRNARDLPSTIASLLKRLASLAADHETVTSHAGDAIIVGGRRTLRADVAAALTGQLDALPQNVRDKTRVPIGVYRGLRFGMVLDPQWSPEVYLEGAATRLDSLTRGHQGPRAVLNALERLANGYASEVARLQQDVSVAEGQLRDYQACVGKPFEHEAYLAELGTVRDQLKVCLSSGAGANSDDDDPSAAELAERIKALKTANTIEAAPQRIRQKELTAEEPVTARICKKAHAEAAQEKPDNGSLPGMQKAPHDSEPLATPFQERVQRHIEAGPDSPRL